MTSVDVITGSPSPACLADVGDRIRAARENARLEQRALAATLGVTQAAVSRWEAGGRDCGVAGLIRVAEACGVPAALLLPAGHQEAAAGRPYRLLVTGSRAWRNVTLIRSVLGSVHRAHPGAVLVSGRCPTGADAIAESCWAAFCGMTVDEAIAAGRIEPHPADWDRYGNAAGPIRNGEMIKAGADECVSFWKRSAENKGTANCVGLAREAGIPVREFWSP